MANIKLTGRDKLRFELNNQKVVVQRAQDDLNRRVNGKPLVPGTADYETANAKFLAEVEKRDALQLALDNYKEPAKPKRHGLFLGSEHVIQPPPKNGINSITAVWVKGRLDELIELPFWLWQTTPKKV